MVEEKLKEKKTKSSFFVCVGDRNKTIQNKEYCHEIPIFSHENKLKFFLMKT